MRGPKHVEIINNIDKIHWKKIVHQVGFIYKNISYGFIQMAPTWRKETEYLRNIIYFFYTNQDDSVKSH